MVVCSAAAGQQVRSAVAAGPDDLLPDADSADFPWAAPARDGWVVEHSADARYEAFPVRSDAHCARASGREHYSAEADFAPDDSHQDDSAGAGFAPDDSHQDDSAGAGFAPADSHQADLAGAGFAPADSHQADLAGAGFAPADSLQGDFVLVELAAYDRAARVEGDSPAPADLHYRRGARSPADCLAGLPAGSPPADCPADWRSVHFPLLELRDAHSPLVDCLADFPVHSVDDFRAAPQPELRVEPAVLA